MLILVPGSGLGNRMRSVASAYALTRRYNTRLVVLWRHDRELNCDFYRLFGKIPKVTVIDYRTPKGKYNWPLILAQKLCGEKVMEPLWDDAGRIGELLAAGKNVFAAGIFQFEQADCYRMFRPAPAVAEISRRTLSGAEGRPLVGVHLRRTDNIWAKTSSTTGVFVRRMRELIGEDERTCFYLSTDSPEEEAGLKAIFGERILSQRDKALDRNSPEGIISAAADLYSLSRCEQLLGSFDSSFTNTASEWNGRKPTEIVRMIAYNWQSIADRDFDQYRFMDHIRFIRE